jgi:hypothetical protein
MGWEPRGNAGTTYFYSSRRGGDGTARKEYVGRGRRAHEAAAAVARRRVAREEDRQAVLDLQAVLAPIDRLNMELDEGVRLLLEAYLLASGFHRINYGCWRKWRKGREQGSETGARARALR